MLAQVQCNCIGPCTQKDTVIGLMLFCHHFEIFNNFILELCFVSSLKGQWNICVSYVTPFPSSKRKFYASTEKISMIRVSIAPCHTLFSLEFPVSREYSIPVDLWCMRGHQVESEYEVSVFCLWLSKQRYWQPWETRLSI